MLEKEWTFDLQLFADDDNNKDNDKPAQKPSDGDKSNANQSGGQQQNSNQQDGNMIPYDRFQQVIEEKNEYKNDLEKLKDQLDNMDDPEEVKQQYESRLQELEQKTVQQTKEFELKKAALAEGVRKEALDDFAKVADLDKVNVDDDGKVNGINDLLDEMKESKSYFFANDGGEEKRKTGSEFKGGGNEPSTSDRENKLRKLMKLKRR